MWKNYLRSALRHLTKNRFYTANNIIGLALAFGVSLYIFEYTYFEKQFDRHIPNLENKARLTIDKYRAGELTLSSAETYVGCGPDLHEQIPELTSYTRTFNMAVRMNSVISYEPDNADPIRIKLKDYYYADSSFLEFFGYELLQGDKSTALDNPKTAVITESLATVYFGDENAIGKILRYQDEINTDEGYIITGVMKDPPKNTHLPFRLLLSYNTFDTRPFPGNYKDSWKARKAYTYFKTVPDADLESVAAKFSEILQQYKDLPEENKEVLKLQPLSELHYTQDLSDEPTPTTDPTILKFFNLIAILILVIAIINFINLSTSSLVSRANEVGVRKVLGAGKNHLVIQYYIQCGITNIVAFILALGLLIIGWPYLNELSGSELPLENLISIHFISVACAILLGTIIISGLIPALLLASFNPVKAISGGISLKRSRLYRQILIVSQFAISFCLIMATLIVLKQLRFMQHQDLGVDIDQVLVVRVPGILTSDDDVVISSQFNQFLNQSKQHSAVISTTTSLTIPGHERAFRTGAHPLSKPDEIATLRFNGAAHDFAETYNMKVISGRNFKEASQYDVDSTIILSESAVEAMGFENNEAAIGQIVRVPVFRLTCEVIGVVNDYRLESVKSDLEPMAFLNYMPAHSNFFSLRLNTNNPQEALSYIEKKWNAVFPGNPMDYFFLDEFFNKQYSQEKKLTQLFGAFGGLAVVLAALGLLGLSAYTAQQRTKEIGVRKALGSSIFQVFKLLSMRFMGLVTLASIIGAVAVYYFVDQWLQQFPVQTEVPLWLYALPLLLLLFITIISISYQTMRVARINPVESLRYE